MHFKTFVTAFNDDELNELRAAIFEEQKQRFIEKFQHIQWPLVHPGEKYLDYIKRARKETGTNLMDCKMAADILFNRK